MDPPVEDSVVRTGENRWSLGSLYVCELVYDVPNDAMASWEADGNTYCIRKSSKDEQPSTVLGDSGSNRIHHAGTSAAVWNIAGTYIKAKSWLPGMELESDTIQYVKRISSIPIPEIIFSWVDVEWDRTFLVLKALKGRTLDQVWESLSANRRMEIADKVAQFCRTLALSTSEMLMTANGNAALEPFLTSLPPASEPSWKPRNLGPFSSCQLRSYLSKPTVLDDIDLFHFYHADLGPSNVIVTDDGSIVGIIDWESAAFYPKFWLGTKPLVSVGFTVRGAEKRAWAVLLASSLERVGFSPDLDKYEAWKKAIGK
ncbi:hypothetical protein LEMA_P056300.1 [Plenodomus lingam JN3]|uniref:Aminoglycoside phosphotransferase domain-containing protein n=2 Tax=Leptosphaeria maculans TaxID=5022 RepID=E4ZH26_LEPMJ|nr:hypothetical protein LEMA_P056300.1 [Plenodomus lingam JN3]CBX90596.1 hypothetical protein LEMA_P056300.1 [Plenodomus lingam JN3]